MDRGVTVGKRSATTALEGSPSAAEGHSPAADQWADGGASTAPAPSPAEAAGGRGGGRGAAPAKKRRRHEDYQIPRMTLARRQEQLRREGRGLEAEFFEECQEKGRVFCRLCACTVGIDSKRFKGHALTNKHRLALALRLSPSSSAVSALAPLPAVHTVPPLIPHEALVAPPACRDAAHPPPALEPSFAYAALVKAANFAACKHVDQRRKGDNSPYINHPLGVANLISDVGGVYNPIILQAAILHDTVEDSDTTLEELQSEFGVMVARIVAEVTDDKSKRKDERKREQVRHSGQLSYEAKLVKLADKLYNLRDIAKRPPNGWDVDRIQGYCVWSKAVITQMAGTNQELEAALEMVMSGVVEVPGGVVSFLPPGNLADALERYYRSMALLDD